MKKSLCCKENMIYLGAEKSKYKWYKYDSSVLKNLIFRNMNFTKWTFVNSKEKYQFTDIGKMLIKSSVDNHFKIAKTNLTDLIHYVKFKRVKRGWF